MAVGEQRPHGGEDRLGLRGGLGQRVRAGGAREVVEAQPQHDRAAHPLRAAQPARDPVDEADERRRRAPRATGAAAQRALRADRAAAPAGPHRPRVAVVGQRVQVPAGRPPEHRDERALGQPGDLADAW